VAGQGTIATMSVAEFDLDTLLTKVEKILKTKKPKPPDETTRVLCEVIASLVVEVARLRAKSAPSASASASASG
jgi:hypothetical protein